MQVCVKIKDFFPFFYINPSLVLFQPRKTRPYITERLLMGCKESNQGLFKDFFKTHMVFKEYNFM